MISVVIPTYNEKENIPELLERTASSLEKEEYEIVFVDDDSPDETWKEVSEYSEKYPIKIIRRKNDKGLASAVVRGIKESKYNIIVVMDADLQHPPEKISELISEVKKGKDVAIGSRFVDEGSVGEFGFLRRIVSRGADFLARTIFRDLRKIKDLQSGFFAFKRGIIDGAELKPRGYKILLEILVKGSYEEVSEVGIDFGERKRGSSKLGMGSAADYILHLVRLSWSTGEISRFLKFCLVGGVGTAVNLIILFVLTKSGLYYLLSGALAIEASLLSNFYINKVWTFKDRLIRGTRSTGKALIRDHIVRSGGIVINLMALWILTSRFNIYYLFSQLIGIMLAIVWNFGGNLWWTWEENNNGVGV